MTVSDYIRQLQGYEEYAFSWEELLDNCNIPESTVRKELGRLSKRREIVNLRKGFYLIIPPRYQSMGKIPIQLYVEKLFRHLGKKYYVGLYSAAAIHGASHQQIQQDYILTSLPALRGINKGNIKLRFFSAKYWPVNNIQKRKSDAGLFNVSSPALTAADLIQHQTKIGGVNRVLANLEELSEEITIEDTKDLLTWYPHKSTIQRLGYIMDQINGHTNITDIMSDHLNGRRIHSTLLSPKHGQKAGRTGNRWKVDANVKLESDLL